VRDDDKREEKLLAIRASVVSAPGFKSRPRFYRPGWKITAGRGATSKFGEDTTSTDFERSLPFGY